MRTAQQILADVQQGELAPEAIHIVETARLTIRDVETGTVEERVLVTERRLAPAEAGLTIH